MKYKLRVAIAGTCLLIILYVLDNTSKIRSTSKMLQNIDISNFGATNLTHLKSRKFGYVMATTYGDQLTGSVANVISMQCWASIVGPGIRVVEPFLRRSVLGVNLDATRSRNPSEYDNNLVLSEYDNNLVLLSDLLSKTWWNKFSSDRKFFPLTDWDYFIEDAPRQLILVNIFNSRYSTEFYQSATLFSNSYGFEIIRNISIPNKLLQEKGFKKLIYGDHNPHKVVVIFNKWKGIQKDRIPLTGSKVEKCNRGNYVLNTPVSTRIINDSIKYANKYLHGVSSNSYISVMVRMEQFLINRNMKREAEISSDIELCFNNLLRQIDTLKVKNGLNQTLLTMDCRKQGSQRFDPAFPKKFRRNYTKIANEAMGSLFLRLYGNSSTPEQWDESFDDVASFKTPGYIAMLQKQLAAKGSCLLTVGGGGFQATARSLHSQYHPTSSNCAATKVPNCE